MKRVLVIGTSGSGKSTIAARIAERLHLPYFATDPFYWEANWTPSPSQKVRELLTSIVEQEAWVLDGNLDEFRAMVWSKADAVVWLDYPFWTTLRRITMRNLRWLMTREEIWSGNRMGMRRAISGIRHSINSYWIKKRLYPSWLAESFEGRVLRFSTIAEAERWLEQLTPSVTVSPRNTQVPIKREGGAS